MLLSDSGKIYVGRAEETEAHVAEALRLSPRDTMAYTWMTIASLAKLHLGSWEQAVAWCRRAIEANRNNPQTYFNLAAAPAQLGRLDEARSAVKAGLGLTPIYSVSHARAARRAVSDDPNVSGRPLELHSRRHAQSRGPRSNDTAAPLLPRCDFLPSGRRLVGYSRLMGEDEAGTARAVREHREAARPILPSPTTAAVSSRQLAMVCW